MSPSLGKMVAKEAALEGGFRHQHSRLIAHAEEVPPPPPALRPRFAAALLAAAPPGVVSLR